jgi:hypothetical protein
MGFVRCRSISAKWRLGDVVIHEAGMALRQGLASVPNVGRITKSLQLTRREIFGGRIASWALIELSIVSQGGEVAYIEPARYAAGAFWR